MVFGQIPSPIFLEFEKETSAGRIRARAAAGSGAFIHVTAPRRRSFPSTPNCFGHFAKAGAQTLASFTHVGWLSILATILHGLSEPAEPLGTRIMPMRRRPHWRAMWVFCLLISTPAVAQGTRDTTTFRRLKTALDAIPAIDTHDHLWPFDRLPGLVETERGKGMNLASLWRNSYFTGVHPLTPWTPGMAFGDWWEKAKNDFSDARATSVYRYQLPAFTDLYNVDF